MFAFITTLINGVALVAMGLIGYFLAENPSGTAFIPVIGGLILLALSPAVKAEKKHPAHAAAAVTLLLFTALWMPLMGALGRDDTAAALRVGLMLATNFIGIVGFVRSFVVARIKRKQAAASA